MKHFSKTAWFKFSIIVSPSMVEAIMTLYTVSHITIRIIGTVVFIDRASTKLDIKVNISHLYSVPTELSG